MTKDRKLHIGGKQVKEDWELLNVMEFDGVDHLMNAKDLSAFEDETFSEVYASHILEHFDFKDELEAALSEWQRVLKKGGVLRVSVPDMGVLCQLMLLKDQLDPQARFKVITMIYGSHDNDWDYHKVGFDQEILASLLSHAGFEKIQRVNSFGLFDDCSDQEFGGIRISLNLVAVKKS